MALLGVLILLAGLFSPAQSKASYDDHVYDGFKLDSYDESFENLKSECECRGHCIVNAGKRVCTAYSSVKTSKGFTCHISHSKKEVVLIRHDKATSKGRVKCTTVKDIEERGSFLSKEGTYAEARNDCFKNNAKPFVPKSKADFEFLKSKMNARTFALWFPIHDMKKEGQLVYEDGTPYEMGPSSFLEDWGLNMNLNTEDEDCLAVSGSNKVDFFSCGFVNPIYCVNN